MMHLGKIGIKSIRLIMELIRELIKLEDNESRISFAIVESTT